MTKRRYTPAQARAAQKYFESTDELRVRMKKGSKDRLKAHAEAHGETLKEFVERALENQIQADNET